MSFVSGLFKPKMSPNLSGFTDWHSHILPGVDDGVESMDESLAILDCYERAGIREVWLTPHIMEDVPNKTSFLKSRFEELKRNYGGAVELHLAAENMIDNLFLHRLEAGDLLPIGKDGSMLLIETSYFSAPNGFRKTIEAIKAKGYYPMLAHPERYDYIDSLSKYRAMKEQGVRFQLNLMSLCGHYGPAVKEKSWKLLSEGMYDRAGSDLHRADHFDILTHMRLPRNIVEKLNAVFL